MCHEQFTVNTIKQPTHMKYYLPRVVASMAVALGFITTHSLADHHKKPVDLEGKWNVTAKTDDGERELVWTIEKTADGFAGSSYDSESGDDRKLDRISVEEKKVTIEIDIENEGNTGVIKVVAEEASAGKLKGTWAIQGEDGTEWMSGELAAEKDMPFQFAGTWNATSVLPDGNELESDMVLTGKNDALKGHFKSEDGNELEIGKIDAKEKTLRLEFEIELEGNSMDVVIEAETKEHDHLDGMWIVKGEDGSEAASGDWSAKRSPEVDYSGDWAIVATVPDSEDDYEGTLTLAKSDDGYTGSIASDGGSREVNDIKAEEKTLAFSFEFEAEGATGVVKIELSKQEDGSLAGDWAFTSDGSEIASEKLTATKKESGSSSGIIRGR